MRQLHDLPNSVVAGVCSGYATKTDCDAVLVPAVERALQPHERVRLY